jgi:hypothetical protein
LDVLEYLNEVPGLAWARVEDLVERLGNGFDHGLLLT